tara:strand:+ start:167 stop:1009 length:843 start_codon:yes stop_codon:yes gene_type:complete
VQNKYYTWYYSIIWKAVLDDRSKGDDYYELHHIIPRSLDKSLEKDKRNMVLLTAKEHFICHLLLPRFVVGKSNYIKMINALIRMQYSKSSNQKRYTSNSYQVVKKLISDKNKILFKGKPKSKEHKAKISKSLQGRKLSPEHREKCAKSNKNRAAKGFKGHIIPHSNEAKKKISEKRKNQSFSKESQIKKSKSLKKYWNNMSLEEYNERCSKISKSTKGRIISNETRKKLSKINLNNSKRIEYEKNPKNCKICKTMIEFRKRKNQCCSRSCARILQHSHKD